MGRILPSGTVFGATPLRVGQAAGMGRGSGPGQAIGNVMSLLQLAEAIGGSDLLFGLASKFGSGVASLFGDDPPTSETMAPRLESAGVTAEQVMAALSSGVQPVAQQKPIPVDRVRLMLTRPGATQDDVSAALAFEGFSPEAINVAIKRALPPGPEDPLQTTILGRVEEFLRADGTTDEAVAMLMSSGAPADQAQSLVAQAFEAINAQQPVADPDIVEQSATAMRQGVSDDEIVETLIRRRLGPDVPLESLDIIDLANQRDAVLEVIGRARSRVGASEKSVEPVANMGQALALAASARTNQERRRAMAAVQKYARPRNFTEMMSGAHQIRAAQDAQRLFPPLERARRVKSPEELQLERDKLKSQDTKRKADAAAAKARIEGRKDETLRKREVAEGSKAVNADKAAAAKAKGERDIKLVQVKIDKVQAKATADAAKLAATTEGKALRARIDTAKAIHRANTRSISDALNPMYKQRAKALAVSDLPPIAAAPVSMTLGAQEKHNLRRLERTDQVASAKATLTSLKAKIKELEAKLKAEEDKLDAAKVRPASVRTAVPAADVPLNPVQTKPSP